MKDQNDVALKKTAYQSSTGMDRNGVVYNAGRAVDGIWQTTGSGPAWWVVDLGKPYYIGTVYVGAMVFSSYFLIFFLLTHCLF